jgi:hypothetical protein
MGATEIDKFQTDLAVTATLEGFDDANYKRH